MILNATAAECCLVNTITAYFLTMPTVDAHHGHCTRQGIAEFSRRMNEKVTAKTIEIVADGTQTLHRFEVFFATTLWVICAKVTHSTQMIELISC